MSGPDEDFDDFLSRRKPLFRRPDDDLQPPEEVDRVVLRRAREAIEMDRPQRAFRGATWGAPLAIAATLLVVFTVILHFMQPANKAIPTVTVQQVAQPVGEAAPAAEPAGGKSPRPGGRRSWSSPPRAAMPRRTRNWRRSSVNIAHSR
jgi:hypothetical protein